MGAVIPNGVQNTVSYNGNGSTGGNVPVDANTYSTGATVTVLGNNDSLVKTGYRFDGWNTQADGLGTAYAPSATFTISASTTLFAKWTLSAYQSWSSGASATSDANNDGIANSIAWLLGAASPSVNATPLQPTSDNTDANYFIYTYNRSDAAHNDPGTIIMVEYGSTLTGWSTAVHDGTNIIINPANDAYSAGVDKVEVRINKTLATSGKLFIRINLQTN